MGSSPGPLFEAIAAPRRRVLCRYVADHDAAVLPLDELTTHALAEEREANGEPVADTDRYRRVATELHHVHLPKLVDAEILRYDPDERLVRAGPNLPVTIDLIRTVRTTVGDGARP